MVSIWIYRPALAARFALWPNSFATDCQLLLGSTGGPGCKADAEIPCGVELLNSVWLLYGANGEGRTPKPFRAPDPKSVWGIRPRAHVVEFRLFRPVGLSLGSPQLALKGHNLVTAPRRSVHRGQPPGRSRHPRGSGEVRRRRLADGRVGKACAGCSVRTRETGAGI